jgi:hypothetical protein
MLQNVPLGAGSTLQKGPEMTSPPAKKCPLAATPRPSPRSSMVDDVTPAPAKQSLASGPSSSSLGWPGAKVPQLWDKRVFGRTPQRRPDKLFSPAGAREGPGPLRRAASSQRPRAVVSVKRTDGGAHRPLKHVPEGCQIARWARCLSNNVLHCLTAR